MIQRVFTCLCVIYSGLGAFEGTRADVNSGKVHIRVIDRLTDRPVPCRIHLKDAAGEPKQAASLPFWRDHFVCPGTVTLQLLSGLYTFEIERGPEYLSHAGSFQIVLGKVKKLQIALDRITDLKVEGWWSGDLHLHRSVRDVQLLMRAEDLHIAPVITWWNHRNFWIDRKLPTLALTRFDGTRYYHVMAGEDE